jgi:hypothetical protein
MFLARTRTYREFASGLLCRVTAREGRGPSVDFDKRYLSIGHIARSCLSIEPNLNLCQ